MRVTVLGASGRTGRLLVAEALERGHDVRALLRDPAGLDVAHDRLRVVAGDALDAAAVSSAVDGSDGVLWALGRSSNGGGPAWAAMMRLLLDAMRGHGVRRLVVIGSRRASAASETSGTPSRFADPDVLADIAEMERLVWESGFDWTIVYPGALSDAPKGGYRVVQGPVDRGGVRTPRADLAEAMVRIAEDGAWTGTSVSVTP